MVVGITGGIGSGKSTVLKYIKEIADCNLLLTDDIAKDLMKPGNISYNYIVDYFGKDILKDDETIDNFKLSKIVFNNKFELEKLNSFTHPYVIKYVEDFINSNNNSLIIIESALLLDTSLKDMCDSIWFVKTDKEIRISRLIEGRGYSRERALEVINNQKKEKDIIDKCDIIINNNSYDNMKLDVFNNLKEYLH